MKRALLSDVLLEHSTKLVGPVPAWVLPAIQAVWKHKPWSQHPEPLAVKWLAGRRKLHAAYWNPKTWMLGVYPAMGNEIELLAHELAHVLEHQHNVRHARLTARALRIIRASRCA